MAKGHVVKTISLTVQCVIRNWVYEAVVNKSTGRLHCIQAGCRTWSSFEAARNHYDSEDKITMRRERVAVTFATEIRDHAKWSDAWIVSLRDRHHPLDTHMRRWAERLEARKVLDRLAGLVEEYQTQVEAKKAERQIIKQERDAKYQVVLALRRVETLSNQDTAMAVLRSAGKVKGLSMLSPARYDLVIERANATAKKLRALKKTKRKKARGRK
jgi:hypothetical protein